MFELRPLGERTFVIQAPVRLGVSLLGEGRVALVDSGLDAQYAKRVLRLLEAEKWTLEWIVHTHSHADHIGGNAVLTERTGCRVLATAGERPFVEQPMLEPTMLYGGNPPRELLGKHTLASPSPVFATLPEGLPGELEMIPLPGHSPDMVGFQTPDGVCFLGDSLLSEAALQKHGIPYLYDVGKHLRTLDFLTGIRARWYVPSHVDPLENLEALIEVNRAAVMAVIQVLLSKARLPRSEEDLFAEVKAHFALADNAVSYALVTSTLRAYLTYLLEAGLIDQVYESGRRMCCTVER